MTKITIGLVTYNRPSLLKRAVKSILNQSYQNFILYIGNDYVEKKVTFKSLGIKKNKKIKIFNYKKNRGERENLNFLLSQSNTEWFSWLGDDDYIHKDFIKILYEGILKYKNKKPVASYSNYSRAKLKNNKKDRIYNVFNKENFLLGFTSKKIRMIGTFGLIKTKILKKIDGIHKTGLSFKKNKIITNHFPYCDPLIPIMLCNYGKIIWIDEKLVYLNTDQNSISAKTEDYNIYISAEKYVFKKLKKTLMNKNYFIKAEIKNQIISNMLSWFLNTRKEILQRRNSLINMLNIIKIFLYSISLFFLLPKKNLKILYMYLNSILKVIIKSLTRRKF